jgi:elongator complex protein 1
MSSFQLSVLQNPAKSHIPATPTPTYVTFSPEDDTMGILWENGYIELWALKMRLGPGPQKIMDPSRIWSGSALSEKLDAKWRQLSIKAEGTGVYFITALGTKSGSNMDVTSLFSSSVASPVVFDLPYRNCRLLDGSVQDVYQGPNGEIFHCECIRAVVSVYRRLTSSNR